MVMGAKGFEEQMRYLKANGYRVITLKEYVEFVSLQRQLPKKSVLITFDDGYRSFLAPRLSGAQRVGFLGDAVYLYGLCRRRRQRFYLGRIEKII